MRSNGKRKKFDRSNGLVVATIALCFAMTIALCFFIGGDGIVSAVFKEKTEERSFYLICTDGGEDLRVARESADLIKKRGGAGYLDREDGNEIVIAVYKTEDGANKVLSSLDLKGAYVKEKTSRNFKLSGDYEANCRDALNYFDLAFEGLYSLASALSDGSKSLTDVNTEKRILYSQIDEIKSEFYENTKNATDEKITSIKLALVTCLALIDVIDSGSYAVALSSIRHQTVQLVYCYVALTNELA